MCVVLALGSYLGWGPAWPQIHGVLQLWAPVALCDCIKNRVGLHKGA